MPQRHDLLLFDLDGTLSDPLEGILRSVNHALEYFAHPPIDAAQCASFVGPPIDQLFQTLTGQPHKHIAELVARYRERYGDLGYRENHLYPGVAQALATLAESGARLAVCTSKRSDFAERILEHFALRELFSFVNGGDIGIHKYQQIAALREQGLVSQTTLMIGDRAVDITAARHNGLPGAGVLWGYGSREELAEQQSLYLFSSPAELLSVLLPASQST